MVRTPLASCQGWIDDTRTGSNTRPASAPSVSGAYGGRHTVVPTWAMVSPRASAMAATVLTVSSLPCEGPMVAVV